MIDLQNKSSDRLSPTPRRFNIMALYLIGLLLLNLGVTFTTAITVNYLKQQPREPLIFDFTLRRGDGGFIVYGVAVAIAGFALLGIAALRRKTAEQGRPSESSAQ